MSEKKDWGDRLKVNKASTTEKSKKPNKPCFGSQTIIENALPKFYNTSVVYSDNSNDDEFSIFNIWIRIKI